MTPAKAVRTDAELECPHLDAGLRARGLELVLLPDGVSEDELARRDRRQAALPRALQDGRLGGAGLDAYPQEPLSRQGHRLSALFGMDNVILLPRLTFYTHEAMRRLQEETLARCDELLAGAPVLVKSRDPRLTAQTRGVRFE
jgi:hypothetical protein